MTWLTMYTYHTLHCTYIAFTCNKYIRTSDIQINRRIQYWYTVLFHAAKQAYVCMYIDRGINILFAWRKILKRNVNIHLIYDAGYIPTLYRRSVLDMNILIYVPVVNLLKTLSTMRSWVFVFFSWSMLDAKLFTITHYCTIFMLH